MQKCQDATASNYKTASRFNFSLTLSFLKKFSLVSHTFPDNPTHLQNQKIFPQEIGFPYHKNRQIKFKKWTGSKIFPQRIWSSLFKRVFNFEMLNFLILIFFPRFCRLRTVMKKKRVWRYSLVRGFSMPPLADDPYVREED